MPLQPGNVNVALGLRAAGHGNSFHEAPDAHFLPMLLPEAIRIGTFYALEHLAALLVVYCFMAELLLLLDASISQ